MKLKVCNLGEIVVLLYYIPIVSHQLEVKLRELNARTLPCLLPSIRMRLFFSALASLVQPLLSMLTATILMQALIFPDSSLLLLIFPIYLYQFNLYTKFLNSFLT